MFDFKLISEAVVNGNESKLCEAVQSALSQGVSAGQILANGLLPGMDIVGEKMENEEMFIPEVLMSARAMGNVLKTITPLLAETDRSSFGKVIIGTVKGDLHDIGKNLVGMMLESAGFEVINLGVDIGPEKFVNEIKARNPDLVCLSALLTTTMPHMKRTVEAIVQNGIRDRVKVMIGGAPVNQRFADEIGADGYAPDAGSAVRLAKAILQ